MKFLAATLALLCMAAFSPVVSAQQRSIDLRSPQALERLHKSDPAAFAQVKKIIAGLWEEPHRAEGNWLQVNFKASDVQLSRNVWLTSLPPKQELRFTIDSVRYTLDVIRTDVLSIARTADLSAPRWTPPSAWVLPTLEPAGDRRPRGR